MRKEVSTGVDKKNLRVLILNDFLVELQEVRAFYIQDGKTIGYNSELGVTRDEKGRKKVEQNNVV